MNNVFSDVEYGKVAYQETQNLKKELSFQKNAYNQTCENDYVKNFKITNGNLYEKNINSNFKNLLKLSVSFTTESVLNTNEFTLMLDLNSAIIDQKVVNLTHQFETKVEFVFSVYDSSNIKLTIESNNEQEFSEVKFSLVGEYKVVNENDLKVLYETNNSTDECIVLLQKNDEDFYKFSYSNFDNLKVNFSFSNSSLDVVSGINSVAYNKIFSMGQYINDELYYLFTKTGINGMFIKNELETKEVKVSNNTNYLSAFASCNYGVLRFVYVEINETTNAITVVGLDENLNIVQTKNINLKLIKKIKSISFVLDKNKNFAKFFNLILTTSDFEIYLVQGQVDSLNQIKISITAHLIGKGKHLLSVENNLTMHMFTMHEKVLNYCKYTHDTDSNNYALIEHVKVLNSNFAFVNSNEEIGVLYGQNFSTLPQGF